MKSNIDRRCDRIGIYVRESRDENGENIDTLETQRDLLIDLATRNNLGELFKVYLDDNVSGSYFERKGIIELKEDIVNGNVNMLLIKDLSRLGRNNAKTLLFLDFLEEYGVRVITSDGRYDSLRDNDTVGIDTWYNERYVRDISRKIRANLRHKIEKGEYIGHAPFGYVKSSEQRNRLCIDRDTVHIVREIFRLYREGYGYGYIAGQMNIRGYPSPSARNNTGKSTALWNPVAVRRILCSRVYKGDTVQGISEKVSFKSKKTRLLPSNVWVVTKGTHGGIISENEFDEVQRIMEERRGIRGQHKGELHLYKGMVFCGGCGSTMVARLRKNRPMGYICGNYCRNGKAACTSHHISERFISAILVDELADMLENDMLRTKVLEMLIHDANRDDSGLNTVDGLEKQILAKQRQQDILYSDRLEGKISEQLFLRMNSSLENRIAALRQEFGRIRSEREISRIAGEIFPEMAVFVKESGITYETARLLVDRITVYDRDDDICGLDMDGGLKNRAMLKGAAFIVFKYGREQV